MEYINGISLEAMIELQTKIELNKTVSIIFKLCNILVSIHNKGILHLDLKPNNVILINDTEIKITDFGIAKMLYDEELVKGIYGTPEYMSPEQHIGQKCGKYTDIYTLGIIFYEMLTGELPFKADDNQGWYEIKKNKQYEPVSSKIVNINLQVAKKIDEIISKCLNPEPKYRYQSVEELKKELQKINVNILQVQ